MTVKAQPFTLKCSLKSEIDGAEPPPGQYDLTRLFKFCMFALMTIIVESSEI